MKETLTELFKYNHFSNKRILTCIKDDGDATPEKVLSLFSHIINAQHIWNSRILGKVPSFGVWEIHVSNSFEQIEKESHSITLDIVKRLDLSLIVSYQNSKGEEFNNSIKDILLHVINHSTYHRGQIATLTRQAGLVPVNTDYIFYRRE